MATLPGGRNQVKIVYGYIRPPKQQNNFIVNDITKSLDSQSLEYHRDFYYLINSAIQGQFLTQSSSSSYGEYDEDFISFNWETQKTKSFNITFTSNPIVVLEIPANADLENINAFIDSIGTTNFSVQLSAQFSGSIIYRAIYSPTYPVTVQRNIVSSAFTYEAVAGYANIVGQSYFTASYSALSGTPTQGWFTPYDFNSSDDTGVALVNSSSFGLTQTTGDISSAIVNRINFIIVKS